MVYLGANPCHEYRAELIRCPEIRMSNIHYMQVDDPIFNRLEPIKWFSKCGEPHGESFSFDIVWVTDWPTATKLFSDPEWGNYNIGSKKCSEPSLLSKKRNIPRSIRSGIK